MTTERKPATAAATKDGTHTTASAASQTGKEHIIVDIGKGSRKSVRKLRKGKPGKLLRRVDEAIDHLRDNGAVAADTQVVVIVVRQRPRKLGGSMGKMWGLG